MTTLQQNSQSNSQIPFIPPQTQIIPQVQPDQVLTNSIPISQQTYPPTQSQPQPSDNMDPSKYHILLNILIERHRRSKHEKEGRIYECDCGKSYLSQPALNNHKKTKHPELNANGIKRGRGRPRKYSPNFPGDFETNKYDNFFHEVNRKKDETQWDINKVIQNVYEFLYEGEHKDKLFSTPEKMEDNILLNKLSQMEENIQIDKKERKCDDVFYEYLTIAQKETNEMYFTLILKFILLFRECFNISKKKKEDNVNSKGLYINEEASQNTLPETLPELCNEFYTDFMENNDFFGITNDVEKNEIIEIIQHFCIWLFKNEYTKSKISLAQ